jgi:uncharacterized protein YjaG (DUF416 family)
VTTPPTNASEDEFSRLKSIVFRGDISKASKEELERFAVILSRPNAYDRYGKADFPQVCETVRTLMIVRMSEQANEQATRISKIALWIAGTALVVALLQAALSAWVLVVRA